MSRKRKAEVRIENESEKLQSYGPQEKYSYKVKTSAPDVGKFITYFSYVDKSYFDFFDNIFLYEYLQLITLLTSFNQREQMLQNLDKLIIIYKSLIEEIQLQSQTIKQAIVPSDKNITAQNIEKIKSQIISKISLETNIELVKVLSEVRDTVRNTIISVNIFQGFDINKFDKIYNSINYYIQIQNAISETLNYITNFSIDKFSERKLVRSYEQIKFIEPITENISNLVKQIENIRDDINARYENILNTKNTNIELTDIRNIKKLTYQNMCFKLDTIHDFTGSRVEGNITYDDIIKVVYWSDLFEFIRKNNIRRPAEMENNLYYWILRNDWVNNQCFIHNRHVPLYISASVENFSDDLAKTSSVINLSVDAGETRIESLKNLLLFNSYLYNNSNISTKNLACGVSTNYQNQLSEVEDITTEDEIVEDNIQENNEIEQANDDVISNLTLQKLIQSNSNIKFQIIFPQIFDANATTGKSIKIKGQSINQEIEHKQTQIDFIILNKKCLMQYDIQNSFVILQIINAVEYPITQIRVYANEIPNDYKLDNSNYVNLYSIGKMKNKFYYNSSTKELICRGSGPGVNELTQIYQYLLTTFEQYYTINNIYNNIFLIKRIGDYSQIIYCKNQNYLYSSNDRMSATFSYIEGVSFIGPFKDAGIFLNFQRDFSITSNHCFEGPLSSSLISFPFQTKICAPDISKYLKFINTLERGSLPWYDDIFKNEYHNFKQTNNGREPFQNEIKKIYLNMAFKLDTIHDFTGSRVQSSVLNKNTILQYLFPNKNIKVPNNLENNFFYWIIQRQMEPLENYNMILYPNYDERPDLVFSASIENFSDCIANIPTLVSIDASEVRIDNFKNMLLYNDLKNSNQDIILSINRQLEGYLDSQLIVEVLNNDFCRFINNLINLQIIHKSSTDTTFDLCKNIDKTKMPSNLDETIRQTLEYFSNILHFFIINPIYVDPYIELNKYYIININNIISKLENPETELIAKIHTYNTLVNQYNTIEQIAEIEQYYSYSTLINTIRTNFSLNYEDKFFELFNNQAIEEISHPYTTGVNFKIIIPQLFDANVTTGKNIRVKDISVSSQIDYDGFYCKLDTPNSIKHAVQQKLLEIEKSLELFVKKNAANSYPEYVNLISNLKPNEKNIKDFETIYGIILNTYPNIDYELIPRIIDIDKNLLYNLSNEFFNEYRNFYYEYNNTFKCNNAILDFNISKSDIIYNKLVDKYKNDLASVGIIFNSYRPLLVNNLSDNKDLFTFLTILHQTIQFLKLPNNENQKYYIYNLYIVCKRFKNSVTGQFSHNREECYVEILNTKISSFYEEYTLGFNTKNETLTNKFENISSSDNLSLSNGIVFDKIHIQLQNKDLLFPIQNIVIFNYNYKENKSFVDSLKRNLQYFKAPNKTLYKKLETTAYNIEVLEKYLKEKYGITRLNNYNYGDENKPFYLIEKTLYCIMGPGVKDLVDIYNRLRTNQNEQALLENIFTIKRAGDYLQIKYCKENDHIFISNDRMSASFSFIENCNFVGPFKDAGLFIKHPQLYNNCTNCFSEQSDINSYQCSFSSSSSSISSAMGDNRIKTNINLFNKFLNIFSNSLKV